MALNIDRLSLSGGRISTSASSSASGVSGLTETGTDAKIGLLRNKQMTIAK